MIVRINQFDAAQADELAGWGNSGLQGPLDYRWPTSAHAFEVLILDSDEKSRPLSLSFRQSQLRRMIPELILAMKNPDEHIVLRFDGALAAGELLGVFAQLTDAQGQGRFAVSESQKLQTEAEIVVGSVRLAPTTAHLPRVCADDRIGLEHAVRLRAFAVPPELVNPLLDMTHADDERWIDILPRAGFVLSTSRGLSALQITSGDISPDQARDRMRRRLLGDAPSPRHAGA